MEEKIIIKFSQIKKVVGQANRLKTRFASNIVVPILLKDNVIFEDIEGKQVKFTKSMRYNFKDNYNNWFCLKAKFYTDNLTEDEIKHQFHKDKICYYKDESQELYAMVYCNNKIDELTKKDLENYRKEEAGYGKIK